MRFRLAALFVGFALLAAVRSPSTADPARHSAGEPLPKSSMSLYTLRACAG